MKLRLVAIALMAFLAQTSICNAQMATISSNGIRGNCAENCVLDLIETDVRITRHEELDPLTEVRVELQQVLTGPMEITNDDGTISIEERTIFKVLARTSWHRNSVDETTHPSHIRLVGNAEANLDGDRRYGTFRLVGKMRTFTGTDDDGNDQFTIPITFIRGTTITLRCGGCDGQPGGQNQGGPTGS